MFEAMGQHVCEQDQVISGVGKGGHEICDPQHALSVRACFPTEAVTSWNAHDDAVGQM